WWEPRRAAEPSWCVDAPMCQIRHTTDGDERATLAPTCRRLPAFVAWSGRDQAQLGGPAFMSVQSKRLAAIGVGLGLALLSVGSTAASGGSVPGREVYMPTRGMVEAAQHQNQGHKPGGSKNLTYHGGVGGSGVVTGPNATVYLVLYGSQWTGNDPSG